MNHARSTILTAALAALVAAVGCASKPNDRQIAEAVQGKIYQDSSITSRQINAAAASGVVTLTGAVASDGERQSAAADAAQVQGVKTVVNDLVVASAAPPAQQTAAEPAAPAAPAPPPARARRSSGRAERRASRSQRAAESAPASPAPSNAGPAAAAAAPAAEAPAAPVTVRIPAGTEIAVRTIDSIDSRTSKNGDVFHASLDSPLVVDGQVVVPKGADVWGQVVEVSASGKFKGTTSIVLALTRLSAGGNSYAVSTDRYTAQSSARGKRTAETVGGGAVIGAIIGAIAGHGKGAAIGAAAGAGTGAAAQELTKAQQVKIASETRLVFHLASPVSVIPASSSPNG